MTMQKYLDTLTAILALIGALYATFSALSKALPTGSRAQLLFARLAIAFREIQVTKRPDEQTQEPKRPTMPPPLPLLCLALVGCTGFQPGNTIASPARCAALSDRADTWGAVAAASGLLGGGSGLTTVATDDKAARISLAVGSLIAGAMAAGAAYASHGASQDYVEENCTRVAERAARKK